jgi:hypothetical protein
VSRKVVRRGGSLSPGHLPDDVYGLVADSVPILCVDVVPRFAADPSRPYLLISRRGYKHGTGWCWVGGRVRIDERLGQAVTRHPTRRSGSTSPAVSATGRAPILWSSSSAASGMIGPRMRASTPCRWYGLWTARASQARSAKHKARPFRARLPPARCELRVRPRAGHPPANCR